MRTIKAILLFNITFLIIFLSNCGSSTDVSDESRIIGHLYTSDGKQPARDTKVILRSYDYLSPSYFSGETNSKELMSPCSAWTDGSGEYVFKVNSTFRAGSYTVEAVDTKGNCAVSDSFIIDITNIESKFDIVLPEDTLKPGSRINGTINISRDTANFIVCIIGLDRYIEVGTDGIFSFDNVPEGKHRLYIENKATEQHTASTLVIKTVSNQTVTVDTLIKTATKSYLRMLKSGNGTVTGADSVEQGEEHVITALADSGWAFSVWKVKSGTAAIADTASSSTTVMLQKGNAEIEAVFSPIPVEKELFNLILSTSGSGKINGKSEKLDTTVESGTQFEVTATANPDYYFYSWHLTEGVAVIADTLSSTTTITMNGGSAHIKAVFGTTPLQKTSYRLYLTSVGSGTINGKTGRNDTMIESGKPFTVTATANPDYYFHYWQLSEGSAVIADTLAATTTIILNNGVADIFAVFGTTPLQKTSYKLYLTSVGSGTINGKTGRNDTMIESGKPYTVTATADPDYYFHYWKLSEGSAVIADTLAPATTITLNNGVADIFAVFGTTPPQNRANEMFNLILTKNGNGRVEGPDKLGKGVSGTIAASPDPDWYFIEWKIVEGTASITNPKSAITSVVLSTSAAQINAVFATSPGN